jgi:hypothetical protein
MIDVELRDLMIHETGPEAGWTGLLVAEGLPIAHVGHDPKEAVRMIELVDGRTNDDMEAVRIALETESPALGAMALGVRCSELVAWQWMRQSLEDMLRSEAVGVVGEGPEAELRSVRVPEGGSIEAAVSHLWREEPGVRILNGMDPDKAVEAWLSVVAKP